MKKIMVTLPSSSWPLARQTPGESLQWGDCTFHINTPLRSCDAWVVLEDLPETTATVCPPNCVMLMIGEHQQVKHYPSVYVSQFAQVYGCHDGIDPARLKARWMVLPWHAGVRRPENRCTLTYDDFVRMTPPAKPLTLSTVCSSKRITPGHRARLAFVTALKARLGDALHVYGRDFMPAADKWDAIHPYHYHLTIENGCQRDYWTEKLADAYLGYSFPLYVGCPNLADYFSPDAFAPIDIADTRQAIEQVARLIQSPPTEAQFAAIVRARDQVLNQYNMMALIAQAVNAAEPATPQPCVLRPHVYFNRTSMARRALRALMGR